MGIAVVTVGYNRPDSMQTLLNSVCAAEYFGDTVDLIISIDKGNKQDEIVEVANKCVWEHGNKVIRAFPEKQGLRNHILQCGDLTEKYDAVVVLEDDLMVSRWYYHYVKSAIKFYINDSHIAGISLYKHQTHPGVYRPFEPVNNGYDVFFIQFAMSWGQCWTKSMWQKFREWYRDNENADLSRDGILPKYISGWNKQSWLKYYMRYIVENNKFFVYPHISLSTNASDAGEHCSVPNNDYQVSMLQGKIDYNFPDYNDAIKYDVFFERIGLSVFPELKGSIILDLYGGRDYYFDAEYCVSTKQLPYKVVRKIQLKYRPIEMNCIMPSTGVGAVVYHLKTPDKVRKVNENVVTRYDVRAIHWKKLLRLGIAGFKEAVEKRIKR